MKLLKNHPLFSLINSYLIDSAEPLNISYLWNFGSLLGVCLVIQIITGITLAMHYTPSIDAAFISVEHIMRDVNYGWLIRYLHANTASFFFLFVYAHMARGLYYGSYRSPRVLVWSIGVVIFLVMIITAFLGYVLPYGQMSLWGATVITNLMSAIPWIGQDIVEFIWGGFSVSNATLNRFFSLHYLLPFVLAALIIMHMIALHESGSNNPVGVTGNLDRLPLHPYFIFKDLVTIVAFFLVLSLFVFYAPNVLGHSDNYIPANPMQTPASIVPEWYLLPFYAILRSIPNKLLGVLAMIAAILVLFLMPIVDLSRLRGNAFKPFSKIAFAIFAVNFLLLMWLGSQHVESPYVEIGQICTAYYFAHFLVIIPAISVFENTLMDVALSDNDNKNSANSVKLNLSINTPLNGLLLKKGGSLAPSPFKEARLFFNSNKIKTLTEYKLIIKNFIIDVFLEIKFVFFNPLTTLKLIFNFFISNKKYLFKFKNFSVSLIIVTLVPRLAPFSADYASYYLDNYNSQEYPLYLNLLLFYFFAFITYFIFALVLYQSILLILFAFKKGTTIQKILAVIFFVNSFSYVFAIINSFIDFKYYISKFISTPLYCSDGNFPSSPGLNPFNDHTGRGEFQPPVNINPEIKAGYDSAIKILEEKRSITERYGIAIGTGTCAKLALQSNSKLLATGFAIGSAISAVSATTDVYDSFKTNYDEGMKKAE